MQSGSKSSPLHGTLKIIVLEAEPLPDIQIVGGAAVAQAGVVHVNPGGVHIVLSHGKTF